MAGRTGARWASALAACVAVATIVEAARQEPLTTPQKDLPPDLLMLAAVGLALATIASLAARSRRPSSSIGLAMMVVGLVVPSWAAWSWLSDDVRADTLALTPLAILGATLLGAPPSLESTGRLPLRAVWILVVFAAATHASAFDPFSHPSCRSTCRQAQPIATFLTTEVAIAISSTLALAATAAGIVAIAARTTPTGRVTSITALGALGLLGAATVLDWESFADTTPPGLGAVALRSAALVFVGFVTCGSELRTRRVRLAVERLVSDVDHRGGGRTGLERDSDVRFAVPGEGRWVDREGHPAPKPASGRRVEVRDDEEPVLLLALPPGRAGDQVVDLEPAALLALRNAQLVAVARARVLDVQESRRRVVEASDAERRRIERDLHDGAQQRLVSALFYLSTARARLPGNATDLARPEAGIRKALANLRSLSDGIYPAMLVTDGLSAALDSLVSEAPVAVTFRADAVGRVPLEIALATYLTAAAALNLAGTGRAASAHLTLGERDNRLALTMTCDVVEGWAVPGALTDVADRIGALGGELDTASREGSLLIKAVIPCVSSSPTT